MTAGKRTAWRNTLLGIIRTALLLGIAAMGHREDLRRPFLFAGRHPQLFRQLQTLRPVRAQMRLPIAETAVRATGSKITGMDHSRWSSLMQMENGGLRGSLGPCCPPEGSQTLPVAAAATPWAEMTQAMRTRCAAQTVGLMDTRLTRLRPALRYPRLRTTSAPFTGVSCKTAQQTRGKLGPPGRSLLKWVPCVAGQHQPTGRLYSSWLASASRRPVPENGLYLSNAPCMNRDPGAAAAALGADRLISRGQLFYRPRSFCNRRYLPPWHTRLCHCRRPRPKLCPNSCRTRQPMPPLTPQTKLAMLRFPWRLCAKLWCCTGTEWLQLDWAHDGRLQPHAMLQGAATIYSILLKPHLHASPKTARSHPRPQGTPSTHGLSGPKSGDRRHLPSIKQIALIHATVGARVSSGVVTEEGLRRQPGWLRGKLNDPAPYGGRTEFNAFTNALTHGAKRAYKRACRRAQASIQEGTMYRGRWHTRQALNSLYQSTKPTLPQQVRAAPRARADRPCSIPQLRVLSWNTSGLSSGLFQELVAWLETNGPWDIVVLQETHWREVSDFSSGGWSCIHSSGYSVLGSPDTSSGILIMLAKRTFSDIATAELIPGRLLQVRGMHNASQIPIDVFGLYQHVHRTHLSEAKNRQLRGQVWHRLQTTLNALPARHQLLIAGDMNSTVRPMHPQVGSAVPHQTMQHHDQDGGLQDLLVEHDLCALNTFHAKPGHTFVSTTSKSQIDFVLVKRKDSGGQAKQAKPIKGFPVAGDRLVNHLPLQATIPVRPFQCQLAVTAAPRRPPFDAQALQVAVQTQPEAAQQMQQAVAARVAVLSDQEPIDQLHQSINNILFEEACRHFPPRAKPDCRISAHPTYRASASHTWELYRRMKALSSRSLSSIWQKWRAYTSFQRASKALKQQSRQRKTAFHQAQLQHAEAAAQKGDHRGLFQVVKQLAPRRMRGVSRLKDAEGHLLSAQAELQAVLKYSKETFACLPDEVPQLPMTVGLVFREEDLGYELAALNPYKAVPQHIAPNAAWRLCADTLCSKLTVALNRHFQAGSPATLQGDMKDAHVIWLPKPSKPPTDVGSLRPIGLMPPYPKIVAGMLAQQIHWHIRPLLDHLPQYAYCAGRGSADAIFRVHQHFEAVERLLQKHQDNRFRKRQGVPDLRCGGGACLSLDLSKAFDSVSRALLVKSLQDLGVPADIIAAVQQLHRQARYHFAVRSQQGSTVTSNGIKQGCRVAPALWVCFSLSILQGLVGHRSLQWVQRVLTLFADDLCACWVITSKADFTQSIRDVELLLELLTIFKLTINYKKTAFLLRLEGKDASKILSEHTFCKDGKTYLRLSVLGQQQSLQIKDSHDYLGTKIAYKNRQDLNATHRIAAAQNKYQMIRKVLNGRGPLSAGPQAPPLAGLHLHESYLFPRCGGTHSCGSAQGASFGNQACSCNTAAAGPHHTHDQH